MEKGNKVTTKMLLGMKVGEIKTLTDQDYRACCSASALAHQTKKRHGVETSVSYRERVDGSYEITVKRIV